MLNLRCKMLEKKMTGSFPFQIPDTCLIVWNMLFCTRPWSHNVWEMLSWPNLNRFLPSDLLKAFNNGHCVLHDVDGLCSPSQTDWFRESFLWMYTSQHQCIAEWTLGTSGPVQALSLPYSDLLLAKCICHNQANLPNCKLHWIFPMLITL